MQYNRDFVVDKCNTIGILRLSSHLEQGVMTGEFRRTLRLDN